MVYRRSSHGGTAARRTRRRKEERKEKKEKRRVFSCLTFFFTSVVSVPPCLRAMSFGIIFLLFSCQSAPKAPEQSPLETGVMPLDKGASAYALVDVADARPILEGISYIPLDDKNMKYMLDRTHSAALAVFTPSVEDDRRFQLVSWGSYPASGSSMAFGSNKDWTKQRSASLNMVYWHSSKAQLSVAVSSSQAYVLAAMTKTPHDPIASAGGVTIPGGFGEFAKGAVFSCWLSDPGPMLSQRLKSANIPLEIPAEQLFIRMFPASAPQPAYETHVQITLPSATHARTIASFISIARAFMPPAQPASALQPGDNGGAQNSDAAFMSLLFANPVVQEGSSLLFTLPPLNARDISLLFSMFSL